MSNTPGSVRALNTCSPHVMRAVSAFFFCWKDFYQDYSNPVGDSHFSISNCYCCWLYYWVRWLRDFHHNWLNAINLLSCVNNTAAQTTVLLHYSASNTSFGNINGTV